MPSTIRDLTELTAIATDDYFLVSDTSDTTNRDKRISRANAFSGYPPITGTTPVAGRVASWASATAVQDAGFLASNVALLNVAQSYSALATFSAGANFGQSTLNWFEYGNWTPTLTFGGASTGMAGSFIGRFTRLGTLIVAVGALIVTTRGSATGNVSIGGLPYGSLSLSNFRWPISIYASAVTYTGMLQAIVPQGGGTSFSIDNLTEAGVSTALTHANFATNCFIHVTAIYHTT